MDQEELRELYKEYCLKYPRQIVGRFVFFKKVYLELKNETDCKEEIFLKIKNLSLYVRREVLKIRKEDLLHGVSENELSLEYLIKKVEEKRKECKKNIKLKPKDFDYLLSLARISKIKKKYILKHLNPCGLSWDALRKRVQRFMKHEDREIKILAALLGEHRIRDDEIVYNSIKER